MAAIVLLLLPAASASAASAGFSKLAVKVLDKEPNEHLQKLAQYSDSDISLARTFLSPAHKKAAQQLKTWVEESGMESWIDLMGNVHGRVNGSAPNAPAIVLGSHYDTVLDGGKYDGALGIIVGIAAIKAVLLQAADVAGLPLPTAQAGIDLAVPASLSQQAGQYLKRPVHLVAFADEEGVRFQSTFLGSRALAGRLVHYGMLQAVDKQGLSMEQVIQQEHGLAKGSVEQAVLQQAMPASTVEEYLEVHIEQGPVLERLKQPLGVVSGIAGQTRLWLTINGTQGHAGTVPMEGRQDALTAAAAVVTTIEAACGGAGHPSPPGAQQDQLVCTVGELRVWPGASNVIAGQTQLSVDIRAKSDVLRTRMVDHIMQLVEELCEEREVECEFKRTHDAPAVLSDEGMMKVLEAAIRSTPAVAAAACQSDEEEEEEDEYADEDEVDDRGKTCPFVDGAGEVPVLISGAGHDTMAMAEITKVAMMFVRCRGGVSHSPLEYVKPLDVAAATAALAEYLKLRLLA